MTSKNNAEENRKKFIQSNMHLGHVDKLVLLKEKYDNGEIDKNRYLELRDNLLSKGFYKVLTDTL